MDLAFDPRAAVNYKSPSQRARVLTESWVKEEAYCPNCGRDRINKHKNNRPVADFYCKGCEEVFELKSKRDKIGGKIVDGAYGTMIESLTNGSNPNFFLLSYDLKRLSVLDFLVIPKHFFVPELIEERKPLSPSAKRSEWIGCNILLHGIPQTGRIFLIRNGVTEPKKEVLANWRRTVFLREEEAAGKGWLIDIMRCIDELESREFSLSDVYRFEWELGRKHPDNNNIRPKIRQQLQLLRDKGYIEFIGKGKYRTTAWQRD